MTGGRSRRAPVPCARSAARSPGVMRSRRPTGASGSRVTASSRRTRCSPRRSTVGPVNRSVLYSIRTSRPPAAAFSVTWKARSNLAVVDSRGSGAASRPGTATTGSTALWKASTTWTSGCRAVDRAGASSSTRRSNGTSAWAKAARSVSRTRASSCRKPGSPLVSVRSTRVLTKQPTSCWTASSVRPATGLPSGMSSPAPRPVSSAASPAWTAMKSVAPPSRASSASRACTAGGTATATDAPRWPARAGRGRSVGRAISSGSPASASRQYASWVASRLPGSSASPSVSRCHSA